MFSSKATQNNQRQRLEAICSYPWDDNLHNCDSSTWSEPRSIHQHYNHDNILQYACIICVYLPIYIHIHIYIYIYIYIIIYIIYIYILLLLLLLLLLIIIKTHYHAHTYHILSLWQTAYYTHLWYMSHHVANQVHLHSTFNMIYVQFQLVVNPSAAVLSRLTHGERCGDVLFGSVGTNCGRHQNFHSLDLHTAKKHILIHSLWTVCCHAHAS